LAGIYIHIPFCKQACYYCNFHFSTSQVLKPEMVKSLIKEIEMRSKIAGENDENATAILSSENEIIETIYFGGGTPSLLSDEEMISIISAIKQNYKVSDDAEITLEANPDDIKFEKLAEWKNAGINRLSIGIQSFIQRDLKWMNRAHDAKQAFDCIKLAADAGYNNFSIDLIFGTPGLTDEEWQRNIDTAINLNVAHISSYALTVEPKTALKKMIALKKKAPVDAERQAQQFLLLMNWMAAAGYEHYEISNFARAGNVSSHNSNYWSGDAYYGFGAAAHSFDGNKTRWWNIPNNRLYTDAMMKNEAAFSFEILNEKQRLDERIMTGLRTKKGFDPEQLEAAINSGVITGEELSNFRQQVKRYIDEGFITNDGNAIVLTRRGIHYADGIAAALFF